MRKILFGKNKNIIHDHLKKIRKERGLSQEELAAKLQVMNVNIDQQMISKIENNSRMATDYELFCLCRVLHTEPNDLMGEIETL